MTTDPWATLRVELSLSGDEDDVGVQAMGLEGLAALVAEREDVGGVETRDTTTLGGATQPELWIYTTPPALPDVRIAVQTLAPNFGLDVRLTGRIREDDDWRDEWKRFYRPQVFGAPPRQLLLRPSWIEREPDAPRDELVLDPGHAFGTGLHESTRLCLQRLCAVADTLPAQVRALDLGCGSGILALALARLKPQATLVAADVDSDATATTRDNAERNGVLERIEVHTGDLTAVPVERFSLLIANIRPVVLVPLAEQVGPWLAPGAQIVLSGIFGDEVDRVRAAWQAAGYTTTDHVVEGDWSLLAIAAPGSP